MSKASAEYARLWYSANPSSHQFVRLMSLTTKKILTKCINNHPKVDDKLKETLEANISAHKKLITISYTKESVFINSAWRKFLEVHPEGSLNIWTNPNEFADYYMIWKMISWKLSFRVDLLPGWPPIDVEPSAEGAFNPEDDFKEDVRSIIEIYTGRQCPDPILPEISIPENADPELKYSIRFWLTISANVLDNDSFNYGLEKFLEPLSMKASIDEETFVIDWKNDADLLAAEEEYLKTHRKLSSTFQKYLETAKEPLHKSAAALVKLAADMDTEDTKKKEAAKKAPVSSEGEKKDDKDPKADPKDKNAEEKKEGKDIGMKEDTYIHPGLVMEYKQFDEKMRIKIEADAKHKAFLAINPPMHLSLAADKIIVQMLELKTSDILKFIWDNSLDESDINDVNFAGICVALVENHAINVNAAENAHSEKKEKANSKVAEGKLKLWKYAARRMLDAALAYASQGARDNELSWYDSFKNVFGNQLTPNRFIQVCEMIISGDILDSYTAEMTIAQLRSANKVIGYRIHRLSSPDLVIQAFLMVKNDKIYSMVEPEPLKSYIRFFQAGVLAQFAAGPLKVYCKGNIDVLTTVNIPSDVTLAQLKPIGEAPYDERIIKQASIILEAFNRLPKGWYQSKKAMRNLDHHDTVFASLVKAYYESGKKLAEAAVTEDVAATMKDMFKDQTGWNSIAKILEARLTSAAGGYTVSVR